MEEREEKRGGSGCFIMGVIAFMLLPVYVLSTGPMTWLVERYPGLQNIFIIYYPLGLLVAFCPPIERALHWYIGLWV